MSGHTPGPWEYEHDEHGTQSEIVGQSECLFEAVCIIPHDDIMEDGWQEMLANTRLIAAAPELLEVLVRLRAMLGPDPNSAILHDVDAAIRKATGAA